MQLDELPSSIAGGLMQNGTNETEAQSALVHLRDTEERIAAEVRDAEQRAAGLIEEAREAAQFSLQRDDSLEHELSQLRDACDRQADSAIASANEKADLALEQLRSVDEATLRSLATWLVTCILTGESET